MRSSCWRSTHPRLKGSNGAGFFELGWAGPRAFCSGRAFFGWCAAFTSPPRARFFTSTFSHATDVEISGRADPGIRAFVCRADGDLLLSAWYSERQLAVDCGGDQKEAGAGGANA